MSKLPKRQQSEPVYQEDGHLEWRSVRSKEWSQRQRTTEKTRQSKKQQMERERERRKKIHMVKQVRCLLYLLIINNQYYQQINMRTINMIQYLSIKPQDTYTVDMCYTLYTLWGASDLIKPACSLTVEWKLSWDKLFRGVSCHVFFRLNPTALV